MRSLSTHLARSILTLTTMVALADCVAAEPEPTEDEQTQDLDGTPQLPHVSVCNGGRIQCKAHVRTDANMKITPAATPSGLGPADLASAYKLSSAKTSTATIAI